MPQPKRHGVLEGRCRLRQTILLSQGNAEVVIKLKRRSYCDGALISGDGFVQLSLEVERTPEKKVGLFLGPFFEINSLSEMRFRLHVLLLVEKKDTQVGVRRCQFWIELDRLAKGCYRLDVVALHAQGIAEHVVRTGNVRSQGNGLAVGRFRVGPLTLGKQAVADGRVGAATVGLKVEGPA